MKKRLYIDMDGVLVDFGSALPRVSAEKKRTFDGRLDEVPGIFSLMDPVADAIDSFHLLADLFDTYILSTAPWENPSAWSDKVAWVRRHLGTVAHKRLILTHHKHLNHGEFLIDDRSANGADRFVGEHLLFGSAQYPNWKSVVAVVTYPHWTSAPLARNSRNAIPVWCGRSASMGPIDNGATSG